MRQRGKRIGSRVAALAAALALGCGDDGPTEPSGGPFQGVWSGTYTVRSCALGIDGDPALCDELFVRDASFTLELALNQDDGRIFGDAAQGQLVGGVEGEVSDGAMSLSGEIGGSDQFATTRILEWQTTLVGDTLFGDWTFRVVDNSADDLGTATVRADLSLYGESVTTLFGCPVRDALPLSETVEGRLESSDCQLPIDGSFFDPYVLTVQAGDSIGVTMRSDSLDAFLILANERSEAINADEDGGGGPDSTDARMEHGFAEGGSFLVMANSSSGGEVGPYTLLAERIEGTASRVSRTAAPDRVRLLADGFAEKPAARVSKRVERLFRALVSGVR